MTNVTEPNIKAIFLPPQGTRDRERFFSVEVAPARNLGLKGSIFLRSTDPDEWPFKADPKDPEGRKARTYSSSLIVRRCEQNGQVKVEFSIPGDNLKLSDALTRLKQADLITSDPAGWENIAPSGPASGLPPENNWLTYVNGDPESPVVRVQFAPPDPKRHGEKPPAGYITFWSADQPKKNEAGMMRHYLKEKMKRCQPSAEGQEFRMPPWRLSDGPSKEIEFSHNDGEVIGRKHQFLSGSKAKEATT